jgi:hypothetical protein
MARGARRRGGQRRSTPARVADDHKLLCAGTWLSPTPYIWSIPVDQQVNATLRLYLHDDPALDFPSFHGVQNLIYILEAIGREVALDLSLTGEHECFFQIFAGAHN